MSILSFAIGPLVGAVIGGVTNKLAIRMLFRPYKAKYIGKVHIPFTPGIIPKEKARIADSIGNMVSGELLNSEVLSATLLSSEMVEKVSVALDNVAARVLGDTQSLEQFLSKYLTQEQFANARRGVLDDITETLYLRLSDESVGEKVAEAAMDYLDNNIRGLGAFALPLLAGSLKKKIARMVNSTVRTKGRVMISDMVDNEVGKVFSKPVCQLLQGKETLVFQVKDALMNAYRGMVTDNLPQILASLDLQRIVRDRINAMDMATTEKMIVDTMDKELKALVWFGVLLGFLMGFVTSLI